MNAKHQQRISNKAYQTKYYFKLKRLIQDIQDFDQNSRVVTIRGLQPVVSPREAAFASIHMRRNKMAKKVTIENLEQHGSIESKGKSTKKVLILKTPPRLPDKFENKRDTRIRNTIRPQLDQ